MNLKDVRMFLVTAVTCATLSLSGPAFAQTAQCKAPDNSKQNQAKSPTADNQPNSTADRKSTQQIRKAIIADKDLSMYAHNCKIITRGGSVTLTGPVHSDDEKQKVGQLAASVVGADHVTNNLTVKAN